MATTIDAGTGYFSIGNRDFPTGEYRFTYPSDSTFIIEDLQGRPVIPAMSYSDVTDPDTDEAFASMDAFKTYVRANFFKASTPGEGGGSAEPYSIEPIPWDAHEQTVFFKDAHPDYQGALSDGDPVTDPCTVAIPGSFVVNGSGATAPLWRNAGDASYFEYDGTKFFVAPDKTGSDVLHRRHAVYEVGTPITFLHMFEMPATFSGVQMIADSSGQDFAGVGFTVWADWNGGGPVIYAFLTWGAGSAYKLELITAYVQGANVANFQPGVPHLLHLEWQYARDGGARAYIDNIRAIRNAGNNFPQTPTNTTSTRLLYFGCENGANNFFTGKVYRTAIMRGVFDATERYGLALWGFQKSGFAPPGQPLFYQEGAYIQNPSAIKLPNGDIEYTASDGNSHVDWTNIRVLQAIQKSGSNVIGPTRTILSARAGFASPLYPEYVGSDILTPAGCDYPTQQARMLKRNPVTMEYDTIAVIDGTILGFTDDGGMCFSEGNAIRLPDGYDGATFYGDLSAPAAYRSVLAVSNDGWQTYSLRGVIGNGLETHIRNVVGTPDGPNLLYAILNVAPTTGFYGMKSTNMGVSWTTTGLLMQSSSRPFFRQLASGGLLMCGRGNSTNAGNRPVAHYLPPSEVAAGNIGGAAPWTTRIIQTPMNGSGHGISFIETSPGKIMFVFGQEPVAQDNLNAFCYVGRTWDESEFLNY